MVKFFQFWVQSDTEDKCDTKILPPYDFKAGQVTLTK